MPGGDEDFGFVADGDDAPDDFGFTPDAPRELHTPTGARRLVLPETTIAAGGPTTVAPGPATEERDVAPPVDAMPRGHRETGRRMTVLGGLDIEGSPTGRGPRQTTVRGGDYQAREVEVDPGFTKREDASVRPVPPPTLLDRLRTRVRGHAAAVEGVAGPLAPLVPGYSALAATADPDAAARGAVNATSLGFSDEYRGAADTAADAIAGRPTDYRGARNEHRRTMREAEERAPGAFGVGELAGSAPSVLIPGAGPTTALGRIAMAGGQGALGGMIRGAGESEAEDTIAAYDQPSLARDAVLEGALEGGAAAVMGGAGEVAAPVAQRVGRWMRQQAATMGDDAARAAVQSRLEASGVWGGRAARAADEMPGGPEALAADLRRLGVGHGVGDPSRISRARAAGEPVNRTTFPRSTRAPDDAEQVMVDAGERMRAVLDEMDDAASGRNSALLEGTREQAMRGMVDLGRVADEMDAIAREYDRLPVGGEAVSTALRTQIIEPMRAHGVVRFSDAHRQRRHLDQMIRGWANDPNLATVAGRLQTARRELSSAMDDAAAQLSPELQQRWRQANRDYSVGAFVGEHGQGVARQSTIGGMGGAVGTGVELAMAGNPVTAIPMAMANRAAAQETRRLMPGVQTRALEGLATRLRAYGARGQTWAQTLEAAQRRGSTSLAAAHAILQRRDPAYRQAIEEMDEAGEPGEE